MFGSLFRILRPIRLIKRKGLISGVFGGDRKWLALWLLVTAGGKIKSLFGYGEPEQVYLEDLKPGERLVVAHPEAARRRKRR